LVGIRHGYRETAAEPILHRSVSPRLALGIQDGVSRGKGVIGIGCRVDEAVWEELPDAAC
jgi:hypothetical protein